MNKTDELLNELAKATSPSVHQLVLDFIIEIHEENILLKKLLNACQQEIVKLYTENNNLKESFSLLEKLQTCDACSKKDDHQLEIEFK